MDLRAQMPVTARRIDRMRDEFGRSVVNAMLRNAMAGQPGLFIAMENHRSVGTPPLSNHVCGWDLKERLVRVADPLWMIDAREFALTLGIEIEVVDVADFEEALCRAEKLRNILRKVSYA